jgi:amino acid transporter
MLAMIGALVPCTTAASRVLYSLGREGVLPHWLASVHPKHRTPSSAIHVVLLLTIVAFAPITFLTSAGSAIAWWGSVIVWFIIVVYFATNLCNIVFSWRFRRDRFSVVWNLFVPLIAMAVQLYVVWHVVIRELWNIGWFGRSAQLFIVLASTINAVYVYSIRNCASGPDGTDR